MPPRRSARLVELANPHFQLPFPPNVVALLFSLLPLDARLRAREVSRGWRFFLEDVSLWQHPDFSEAAAESPTVALTWGLVRAVCARAKGTLHTLRLDTLGLHAMRDLPLAALGELLAENSESLRLLTLPLPHPTTGLNVLKAEDVARLRQAAPLCVLSCAVKCTGAEVAALLGCDLVCPFSLQVDNLETEQQLSDLSAALATRTGRAEIVTVVALLLMGGNLVGGAALEDLARATVVTGTQTIAFCQCGLTQLALPALTLLLRSNVLDSLNITNDGVPLFTGPELPAFCDALRSNSSLVMLQLHSCALWADPAAACMLLAALAARTIPSSLWLYANAELFDSLAEQAAVGTQLAQLITAGGLKELQLWDCDLGEAGLAPIFEALSLISPLSKLCVVDEELSLEFSRDVVLPAVRTNTSLRTLFFRNEDHEDEEELLLPELVEAQNIVNTRL